MSVGVPSNNGYPPHLIFMKRLKLAKKAYLIFSLSKKGDLKAFSLNLVLLTFKLIPKHAFCIKNKAFKEYNQTDFIPKLKVKSLRWVHSKGIG